MTLAALDMAGCGRLTGAGESGSESGAGAIGIQTSTGWIYRECGPGIINMYCVPGGAFGREPCTTNTPGFEGLLTRTALGTGCERTRTAPPFIFPEKNLGKPLRKCVRGVQAQLYGIFRWKRRF